MATSFVKSLLYQEGKHKESLTLQLKAWKWLNFLLCPHFFFAFRCSLKCDAETKCSLPHERSHALLQSESENMHGTKRMDCFSLHPIPICWFLEPVTNVRELVRAG